MPFEPQNRGSGGLRRHRPKPFEPCNRYLGTCLGWDDKNRVVTYVVGGVIQCIEIQESTTTTVRI